MIAAIFLVLLLLLIVRLVRRKKRPASFQLRDVGSMIDRSISAYRRHLIPALMLSAICLPLGSSSAYSIFLLSGTFAFIPSMPSSEPIDPILFLIGALTLLGAFGIGKILLVCGIAAGMRAERHGQPITFGALVPQQRPGAVLALILLMIIPSILSSVLGLIGGLICLFWALAPVAMLHEDLGPWAAIKRSWSIVRAHYSALLNTLVPLWLIGWLIVGTPLFVSLWLLGFLGVGSVATSTLLLCGWLIGQICVAPITAFGAVCCYLYVQEHATPPASAVEMAPAWEQLQPENRAG
jgi:hypothetical protein